MNMINNKWYFNTNNINIFNKYIFLLLGIFFAYTSSLSVLNLESDFWLNDEGLFFDWGSYNWLSDEDKKNIKIPPISFNYENEYNKAITISIGYTAEIIRYYITYKLFVTFISVYFFIFKDPFIIVFKRDFLFFNWTSFYL